MHKFSMPAEMTARVVARVGPTAFGGQMPYLFRAPSALILANSPEGIRWNTGGVV
jgi:hypothetical protein